MMVGKIPLLLKNNNKTLKSSKINPKDKSLIF